MKDLLPEHWTKPFRHFSAACFPTVVQNKQRTKHIHVIFPHGVNMGCPQGIQIPEKHAEHEWARQTQTLGRQSEGTRNRKKDKANANLQENEEGKRRARGPASEHPTVMPGMRHTKTTRKNKNAQRVGQQGGHPCSQRGRQRAPTRDPRRQHQKSKPNRRHCPQRGLKCGQSPARKQASKTHDTPCGPTPSCCWSTCWATRRHNSRIPNAGWTTATTGAPWRP